MVILPSIGQFTNSSVIYLHVFTTKVNTETTQPKQYVSIYTASNVSASEVYINSTPVSSLTYDVLSLSSFIY